MILENTLEKWNYARLLIADYHLEYPLSPGDGGAKVQLLWNPFELSSIAESLQGEGFDPDLFNIAQHLFGPLEQKYPDHWEPDMNLWLIQGSLTDLWFVFDNLWTQVMHPPSGDDDTFDYWPNAVSMLRVMAVDLIELGVDNYYKDRILSGLQLVLVAAERVNGPMEEWEAQDLRAEVLATVAVYKGGLE